MKDWSLTIVLGSLHDGIEQSLTATRESLAHSTSKGDASEGAWLRLLSTYLPSRYQAASAHVADSEGNFSDQIDVVIFDRQYTPFILVHEGSKIIPAESVYAVFEAKQVIDARTVRYAAEKVASVRRLHRTNQPIPHAGGTYKPRPLPEILGGILALESGWKQPLGRHLREALGRGDGSSRLGWLDLGCVAKHGTFQSTDDGGWKILEQPRATTAFLFELIARLQASATVPMLDVRAYAKWIG